MNTDEVNMDEKQIMFSFDNNLYHDTDTDTDSWVQSGGPVTTESIVRFDTWFELFEVFRKNLAPMTLAKMAAEFVRSQNPKWPPAAILEM